MQNELREVKIDKNEINAQNVTFDMILEYLEGLGISAEDAIDMIDKELNKKNHTRN